MIGNGLVIVIFIEMIEARVCLHVTRNRNIQQARTH